MKKIVLSLGGSLIIPDQIRTEFLQDFRKLVLSRLDEYQFVIFTGGGITARTYMQGLEGIIGDEASSEAKDWLGIYSSWVNARLVYEMFKEHASDKIIVDPTEALEGDAPITIGGGWKPGWSTDYDAVEVAWRNGFDRMVNLSNIEYVYDKDPAQFEDAQAIKEITWPEFRKIVGSEWTPGLSMPFDPIASKLAEEKSLEVLVANGANIENIEAILDNKPFVGTRIIPAS